MNSPKFQYLIGALLAAALCGSGSAAGEEVEALPSPAATVTATPLPSPTPRIVPVALYFRRPAKIIPVYRQESQPELPLDDFLVADEMPWLTENDIRWFRFFLPDHPDYLQIYLTPEGVGKYSEAKMGNFGRTVILVIDGTVRSVADLEKIQTVQEDRIDFHGNFPARELEELYAWQISRAVRSPH